MTETALYRLFNADGKLLYVGVTDDTHRRWVQHAKSQGWWPEVQSKTVEWHGTRGDAELAEKRAVREELPVYNLTYRIALASAGGAEALAEAKAAHDAIADAEREAKRLIEEARINFGHVVNKVIDGKHAYQEDVADEIGKTREYVRRLQVKARRAAKKKET